jgi:hypothetical protein
MSVTSPTSSPPPGSSSESPSTENRSNLQAHRDGHHLTEPGSTFYWVRVSCPADVRSAAELLLPRHRHRIEEQLELAVLPPLDTLAWTGTAEDEASILVCLQERATVRAARQTGATHYGPSELPKDVRATMDAATINLLAGQFAPLPIVNARRRINVVFMTMVLLVGLALAWGFERRLQHHRDVAQVSLTQAAELARSVGLSSLTDLRASRYHLVATRQRLTAGSNVDAGLTLTALLLAWPSGPEAPILMTDSVSIGDDLMVLQVNAMSRDDATQLTEQLSVVPELPDMPGHVPAGNWVLGQPQISTVSGMPKSSYPLRVTLRFMRQETQPKSGGTND